MKLSEYVTQVINDPKYGHDIEWVKGNLHRAHLERIEAAHDAEVRAGVVAEEPEPMHLVDERDPECVKEWADCREDEYNPACCRFPKPCRAGYVRVVPVKQEGAETDG